MVPGLQPVILFIVIMLVLSISASQIFPRGWNEYVVVGGIIAVGVAIEVAIMQWVMRPNYKLVSTDELKALLLGTCVNTEHSDFILSEVSRNLSEGDLVYYYSTGQTSQRRLCSRTGVCIKREGKIIADILISMS